MFGFLKNLTTKLNDGDERYFTEKEHKNNNIYLPYTGSVTVSTDRKRLYINSNSSYAESEHPHTHIYEIYDYVLNGYDLLIKQIQYSIERTFIRNKQLITEKQFMIKNGDVWVDGIYKWYNDSKNYRKEKTLEEEIEKWRKRCLLSPLNKMELTMFILSKSLTRDSLQKAINEKIKLMEEGKKNYDTMLLEIGITKDIKNYLKMEKELENKGKLQEYNERLYEICKKCGCDALELNEFDETIEKIKSYLK